MGSDFKATAMRELVSYNDAAKMLGRSTRTVKTYVQNGLLRRIQQGKAVGIPREDVDLLAVDIGAGTPPMNKKTFFQLVSRVRQLEAAVAVLQKATNIGFSPMRPDKEAAVGLYEAVVKALAAGYWSVQELGAWIGLYEKMDEVFFDTIAQSTGDTACWRPFLQLCTAQARLVSEMPDFNISLPIQHLHAQLCAGLKTLRGVALVWIEAGNGVAESIVDQENALIRRLAANKAPTLG